MSGYDGSLTVSPQGSFTVTAHGLKAGEFHTRAEAQAYIQHILHRDLVESRAREGAARELKRLALEWSEELGLPIVGTIEDIKAALDEALLDLLGEVK
jgi:hypothetical protein